MTKRADKWRTIGYSYRQNEKKKKAEQETAQPTAARFKYQCLNMMPMYMFWFGCELNSNEMI